jgi:hypothetical protein
MSHRPHQRGRAVVWGPSGDGAPPGVCGRRSGAGSQLVYSQRGRAVGLSWQTRQLLNPALLKVCPEPAPLLTLIKNPLMDPNYFAL